MDVEIRHLRIIVTIAETGSLNRAAKQLGVSQPGLTGQLQRIENSLGGQLFFRAGLGSSPTPLGHTVLDEARAVLRGMDGIQHRARTQQSAPVALRIGGYSGFLHVELGRWLAGTTWANGIRLYEDFDPQGNVDAVARGSLDMALVHEWPGFGVRLSEGLRSEVVSPNEPVLILVGHDHRLAAEDKVRLEAIAEYPWVDEPHGMSQWPAYVQQVCHGAGIVLRQQHEVLFESTIRALVQGGGMIAPGAAACEQRPGELVVRGLVGNPLKQSLRLVYRAGSVAATRVEEICAFIVGAYERRQHCNRYFQQWWQSEGRCLTPAF